MYAPETEHNSSPLNVHANGSDMHLICGYLDLNLKSIILQHSGQRDN